MQLRVRGVQLVLSGMKDSARTKLPYELYQEEPQRFIGCRIARSPTFQIPFVLPLPPLIIRHILAPLLFLCLPQGRNNVPSRRCPSDIRVHRDIRVVVRIPPCEAGPAHCPTLLRPVLGQLEAASAKARQQASRRLCQLNWRHLSWLRKEAGRGGAERRLALRVVTKRLEDRRLAGEAPQSLALETGEVRRGG